MKQCIKSLAKNWEKELNPEFSKSYFIELQSFITAQRQKNDIYPNEADIFTALNNTPLKKVKVVILGQDPYHGENQAHGLSFSVQKDVKVPPSLRNIYKELNDDLDLEIPGHGNLTQWAKNGVLLLNTVLTVSKGEAGSHRKRGWEEFTDKIIQLVNEKNSNVVFILWGSPAQKKETMINTEKHLVIKAPHPSPLSSYRGFFGSKPFSKANKYLISNGKEEINWKI